MRVHRVHLSLAILLVLALVIVGVALGVPAFFISEYDDATVRISDENGTELAVVHAAVADTPQERYAGLSDTDSLSEHEGMLFVFDDEDERAFVMRDMDFPIDIIFIGADGRITTIHEAPVEEGTFTTRYRGDAKWVLEVNYGYAASNGITVGDEVSIEYAADRS